MFASEQISGANAGHDAGIQTDTAVEVKMAMRKLWEEHIVIHAITSSVHWRFFSMVMLSHSQNRIGIFDFKGENDMAIIEQMELIRYRDDITADVSDLVDKYRAIFDLDVPGIDQHVADKLIFVEIRKALEELENKLIS